MEENKPSFFKNTLYWGVILGVIQIIFSLIFYFLDLSLEPWVSWIGYIIMIGALIFATTSYRNTELGGTMTYGQSLGFGVMVVLYGSIIVSIYTYIFMQYIDPGFVEKILQMSEEKMIEKGIPENQIEMGIEMQRKFMKPWLMSLLAIPMSVFMGLIFSSIISIFTKKKPAEIPFEN